MQFAPSAYREQWNDYVLALEAREHTLRHARSLPPRSDERRGHLSYARILRQRLQREARRALVNIGAPPWWSDLEKARALLLGAYWSEEKEAAHAARLAAIAKLCASA